MLRDAPLDIRGGRKEVGPRVTISLCVFDGESFSIQNFRSWSEFPLLKRMNFLFKGWFLLYTNSYSSPWISNGEPSYITLYKVIFASILGGNNFWSAWCWSKKHHFIFFLQSLSDMYTFWGPSDYYAIIWIVDMAHTLYKNIVHYIKSIFTHFIHFNNIAKPMRFYLYQEKK